MKGARSSPTKTLGRGVFSLRATLVVLTIFCAFLGLYAARRNEREFVTEADCHGCQVELSCLGGYPTTDGVLGRIDQAVGAGSLCDPQSLWVPEVLGNELVPFSAPQYSWILLANSLTKVQLDGGLLDDQFLISLLDRNRDLHTLRAQNATFTRKGAMAIVNARTITEIVLAGDAIDDEIALEFAKMQQLRYLHIRSDNVSQTTLAKLRRALPDAEIFGP